MNVTFLQFPPTHLTTKNHPAFAGWLEAVEKLSFFEQPLDRNHAFDRMLKKNRVLRTHFFFPCIKTEVHAPGFYEFAAQILFYACYRTKHKKSNIAFSTSCEAHRKVCLSPCRPKICCHFSQFIMSSFRYSYKFPSRY